MNESDRTIGDKTIESDFFPLLGSFPYYKKRTCDNEVFTS